MADLIANSQAERLLDQGGSDEEVEAVTGLSLTEIIALRAERAARTANLPAAGAGRTRR